MVFKKQSLIEKLSKKSSKCLDIFTKTKDELQGVNSEIVNEKSKIKEEKIILEEKDKELDSIFDNNIKVINNINKIFE